MAKLGTSKHPVIVRVQTPAKAEEIMSVCDRHGWQVIVGIEPDQAEDISDVERLLEPLNRPKRDPPQAVTIPAFAAVAGSTRSAVALTQLEREASKPMQRPAPECSRWVGHEAGPTTACTRRRSCHARGVRKGRAMASSGGAGR
jgi:hypothetical protein